MSKKDSYWFRHDSTAGRALKMRKMSHIYGHWGKGIYWDVCEILRDNENYSFESDESSLQMLSDLIGCKDENKFISWYKDCIKFNLLEEQDNYFFSPALSESMKKWDSAKANGSKGGRPKKNPTKSELKPKQKPTGNPTKSITLHNNTKQDIITNKFLEWFNNQKLKYTGKKGNFKGLSKTDINNLKKLTKDYDPNDFNNAIPSLFANQWAKDTNNLTPTHFLRVDNFNKYLNQDSGIAPAPKTESLYD